MHISEICIVMVVLNMHICTICIVTTFRKMHILRISHAYFNQSFWIGMHARVPEVPRTKYEYTMHLEGPAIRTAIVTKEKCEPAGREFVSVPV